MIDLKVIQKLHLIPHTIRDNRQVMYNAFEGYYVSEFDQKGNGLPPNIYMIQFKEKVMFTNRMRILLGIDLCERVN